LLNGAALRAVGYTKDTPEPPGGQILRDADGTPTGLLVAKPNVSILYATLAKGPKLPFECQVKSTRHFMRELNRLGVTGAIDAGGADARWMRDAAFWIASAATSTMPGAMMADSSAALSGPSQMASTAPIASNRNSSVSIVRRTGSPNPGSENASMRVTMMTAQKTGSANSFAAVPELPNTAEAPIVTKRCSGRTAADGAPERCCCPSIENRYERRPALRG